MFFLAWLFSRPLYFIETVFHSNTHASRSDVTTVSVYQWLFLGIGGAIDAGAESSDSDIDHAYVDEPSKAETLWTPSSNYDQYKARVTKELALDEEEKEDEEEEEKEEGTDYR